MSERNYDEFFEHEHDGIREYDNPLPGWWKWLFVLSIIFSALYYFHYHLGLGKSVHEKYDAAVVANLEKQLSGLGELRPDDATILRLVNEHGETLAAVGGIFRGNCAQCHASDGGGSVGPNLTDDHWKNVKQPADIYRVLVEGIPGTAMQSWSTRFREPQLILLASYVASLRGTTPAAPKAAEGSVIPPWTAPQPPPPPPATSDASVTEPAADSS